MGKTHFSGPLVVGGKQLTDNDAIALLNLTISETYSSAEVQAIANKVDEIINTLIAAGIVKQPSS